MRSSSGLPPSRRQRRERRSKQLLGVAILGVFVVMGTAASLILLAREWNPYLDDELCPTDRPPVEEVIALVDVTDAWNATQRAVIREEFRRLQQTVPRFGRIHLYTVRPTGDALPTPLLRLCNPGRPSDFDEFPMVGEAGSRVVANPEELEATWSDGYGAALDSILEREVGQAVERQSPIMETLRAAAIDVFGTGEPDNRPRRVHVFSDLLQHTERHSVYTDPEWTSDDGLRLADPGLLGTASLEGAQLYLYLLDRDIVGDSPGHERGALVRLWDRYFEAQGATVMRVRRIEG